MTDPNPAAMLADDHAARMRAAARRVRDRAPIFGDRHTSADADTGDEWDRGQVLSHVAEFLPYWTDELSRVVAAGGNRHPFGRVKETPSRLARIEEGRSLPYDQQLDAMDAGIDYAVAFMRRLGAADWNLVGLHPRRGDMTVRDAVDRFFIEHLEEHCEQLAP